VVPSLSAPPAPDARATYTESDTGYFNQQVTQRSSPRRQQRARSKAPGRKETQVKDTTSIRKCR